MCHQAESEGVWRTAMAEAAKREGTTMSAEENIGRLGELLTLAAMADDVVYVLSRVMKHGELDEADNDTLDEARDFVGRALDGQNIFERESLGVSAVRDARAFRTAVDAWYHAFRESEKIEVLLAHIRDQLGQVVTNAQPPHDLDDARKFFMAVSAINASDAAKLRQDEGRWEGSPWSTGSSLSAIWGA